MDNNVDDNEIYVNLDLNSYSVSKEEVLFYLQELMDLGYIKTMKDIDGEILYSLTEEGEKYTINNIMKMSGRLN